MTRETYDDLSEASYAYTVRGFDDYDQFRTFDAQGPARVGVIASFDRTGGGYEFATLHERFGDVFDRHDDSAFRPAGSGGESPTATETD